MATSMFFRYKNGWDKLSDPERYDRLCEWHKKHCQPSLFDERAQEKEVPKIWEDTCRKYTDKRQEERNNRQSETASKITDDENKTFEKELTAIYHFKGVKYTKDIFFYDKDKGIYTKDAEWLIEQECVRYNPEIKTKDVTDIKNRIKWSNYVDESRFDADIEWIAVKNCKINLKTLETKPHSPEFMATMQIPHKYEPSPNFISDFLLDKYQDSGFISDFWWQVVECPCPKIMRFLHEVMAPEDVETVLDFIAYCLWRGFPFHRYLLFNGSGRNGKGVTIELIKRFLGRQNISGKYFR
jgi:phage/plasmid-associated DNA primase